MSKKWHHMISSFSCALISMGLSYAVIESIPIWVITPHVNKSIWFLLLICALISGELCTLKESPSSNVDWWNNVADLVFVVSDLVPKTTCLQGRSSTAYNCWVIVLQKAMSQKRKYGLHTFCIKSAIFSSLAIYRAPPPWKLDTRW